MQYLTTAEIRNKYREFFVKEGHTALPSSSLLPQHDPSLLFVNAGMVQFKDLFLGKERYAFTRATTCQRCLRASGKHNDLENVGYTTRHHTFFEMLGNFSFGDYFKTEAIHFAWKFLTEELAIDPKRLWITVHHNDHESEALWKAEFERTQRFPQGLSHCGDADNFWSMGSTGPCGFCSEIYYDHGDKLAGDPPGGEVDGERYVEIWNLVFMQFNRDENGVMTPLPHPSIDTGMGLERIAAVMQGVYDNYDTDTFVTLREAAGKLIKQHLEIGKLTVSEAEERIATRVIVDHIRSTMFLIADSVLPANEGQGYVLRSIIRRAVYHLVHLGIKTPLFYQLIAPCVAIFNDVYPELKLAAQAEQISIIVQEEERRFLATLERGLKLYEEKLATLTDKVIPGGFAFMLHDTYGFPIILTAEIAKARGLTLDKAGFDAAMQAQKERARAARGTLTNRVLDLSGIAPTEFVGYEKLRVESSILALFSENGNAVAELNRGEFGTIVVAATPFYGESGGEVGDHGQIVAGQQEFQVVDTQKEAGVYLHYGSVTTGTFTVGMKVTLEVAEMRRQQIAANHSATHLLHKSLRTIIGEGATQRGSLVDADHLRFDFAHKEPLTADELQQVETLVNQQIHRDLPVKIAITSLEEANKAGFTALFGEKYGNEVRTVAMGDFSRELCGGCHVAHTGLIGSFKIVRESNVAAGVRRIEAVTGEAALEQIALMTQKLGQVAELLSVGEEQLLTALKQHLALEEQQAAQLEDYAKRLALVEAHCLVEKAVVIADVKVVMAEVDLCDGSALRTMADTIRQQLRSTVVVLVAMAPEDKLRLLVSVTKDLTAKVEAGALLKHLLQPFAGRGGGNAILAQGGSNGATKQNIGELLANAEKYLREKLGQR